MKMFNTALLATGLVCMASVASANSHMDHDSMKSDMAMMDSNADGMLSKEEYMAAHEAKWAKMSKNKDGMVSMKDMESMHDGKMMKDDKMMNDAKPMKKGDN